MYILYLYNVYVLEDLSTAILPLCEYSVSPPSPHRHVLYSILYTVTIVYTYCKYYTVKICFIINNFVSNVNHSKNQLNYVIENFIFSDVGKIHQLDNVSRR